MSNDESSKETMIYAVKMDMKEVDMWFNEYLAAELFTDITSVTTNNKLQ